MAKSYQVQELVAGKWYAVRSYENKADAEEHARQLGRNARVKEVCK